MPKIQILRAQHIGIRLFILCSVLASMFMAARPAYAASIIVTTTADVIDAGVSCPLTSLPTLPGPDGQTSLREAVCAANNNPGADTISFAVNGVFFLTGVANEDNGTTGDLDIKQSLAINGNGTANTIIDGGGIERIFDVFPSAASTFDLINLTIQNGDTRIPAFKEGGAIYLHNNVTSVFTNITVQNNFSGANGAIESRGTLTINNSTITNNQTIPSSGSVVGGGIHNAGTLTINNTTISGNTVRGEGGGLATSTILGLTTTINGSTISGNTASITGGGNGNGGGISTTGNQGQIIIKNSTISGNNADNNGGGIYAVTPAGGTGTVTLDFSTITANTADSDNNSSGAGGGVFQTIAGVTASGAIIAGNTNTTSAQPDYSGAISGSSASNLIGNGTGMSGITHGANGNLVGTAGSPIDAMLLGLASNGGSTQTHALNNGSPALEQIASGSLGCGSTYTTDQRGNTRPGSKNQPSNKCEMGAWEAEFIDATAVNLEAFNVSQSRNLIQRFFASLSAWFGRQR